MAADLKHVKELLRNHTNLEIIKDALGRRKVKCKLTGHELPCQLAAVDTYIKGKKYQRLCGKQNDNDTPESSIEEWKVFLVPSQRRRNQLFCKLTRKYINNLPHHITGHFNGRRFKRALGKYDGTSQLAGEPGVKNTQDVDESMNIWVPPDEESDSEDDYTPDLEGFRGSDEEEQVSTEENSKKMEDEEFVVMKEDDVEDDTTGKPNKTSSTKRKLEAENSSKRPKKSKETSSGLSKALVSKKQKNFVKAKAKKVISGKKPMKKGR